MVGDGHDRYLVFRSLPLLWLSLAFLIGILLAAILALPLWAWALLALAAAAGAMVWRRRLSWLATFGLVAAMVVFLGALRFQAALPAFTIRDLAYYNDGLEPVEVLGVIDSPPVRHDSYIELRVQTTELIRNDLTAPIRGLLLARVPSSATDLLYGDQIRLFSRLVTPETSEGFSYRDYLARQGTYSLMPFAAFVRVSPGHGNPVWAAIHGLRQSGLRTLSRLYPPQESGLLSGILLGDETGISIPLQTAFNDTGTRHIIAISGFNITIIAGVFLSLSKRWLGVRRGIWLAGAGVAFYTILVGAEASVVRAAIMGLVALVALYVGRQSFALNTLAIAAALMALLNPLVLWDVGFQLSFAATLGLVLFAGRIRNVADGWLAAKLPPVLAARLSDPLADYVYMTVAAQVTTLPLLLFYFQRLSLLSVPVNLLILPVQPAVMILGGLSTLLGMIFQPLGQLVALIAVWPVTYTVRIVEFFARLPGSSIGMDSFPIFVVFGYYVVVAVLTIPLLHRQLSKLRLQPIFALGLLAAASLWVWSSALAAPDGMLSIVALDVGGEAILVRTPTSRNLLINAGPSSSRLADELQRELPYGQKLDWLLVAGRQQAQVGSLAAGLESLSPVAVAWAAEDDRVAQIVANAQKLDIADKELQTGDQFDLGYGATLTVIARGSRGAVLLLDWRQFSALLPLGLDFDVMGSMDLATIPPVDLYLLADGGYPPLNPVEWVAGFTPAVVWAATGDRVGLDTIQVLTTGDHGWLRLTTDGNQMWLESSN